MRGVALFGLAAMVPASLNAAAPASVTVMALSCTGAPLAIAVPLAPGAPVRDDGQSCFSKGCHTGGSRKRLLRGC